MASCVILLEDEEDLAHLVQELLSDSGYTVIHVRTTEVLLEEAARRSPCLALLDSTDSKAFDLWPLGPKLAELGVPCIAFTAHASAVTEFETNKNGFVGIVPKPFDVEDFLAIVDSICWEDNEAAAS